MGNTSTNSFSLQHNNKTAEHYLKRRKDHTPGQTTHQDQDVQHTRTDDTPLLLTGVNRALSLVYSAKPAVQLGMKETFSPSWKGNKRT